MNNPLKLNGFTFYQASFQENKQGQATTSILSVNRDPGRWMKYLGSLFIVLGTVVMFYFKRYRLKIFAKLGGPAEELA
jgi:cytochrome c biogenesis protein ResB